MGDFNYQWRANIVRELDSDTRIDLTLLLKQETYRIFNITNVAIRIFMDGGIVTGIDYKCNDHDATIDEITHVCDFTLPPFSSKSFILNRWGTGLQVKD